MISCPLCLTGPDEETPLNGSWALCRCGKFGLNVLGKIWRFESGARPGHVEMTLDNRLVYVDLECVRHHVPQNGRGTFIQRYVEQAMTWEVIDS